MDLSVSKLPATLALPVGIYLGRGVMGKKAECERKGRGDNQGEVGGTEGGEHRGQEREERRGGGRRHKPSS